MGLALFCSKIEIKEETGGEDMKKKLKEIDKKRAEIMGYRLCALRIFHKISQSELAQKLDCSQRYISKLEAGESFIPSSILFQLCNIFYIDPSYFDPEKPGIEQAFLNQTILSNTGI